MLVWVQPINNDRMIYHITYYYERLSMSRVFKRAVQIIVAAALSLTVGFSGAAALPPGGLKSNTPGTWSNVSISGNVISYELHGFPKNLNQEIGIKIDDGYLCPAGAPQGACVVAWASSNSEGVARGQFRLDWSYQRYMKPGAHTLRFLASGEVEGKGFQPFSHKTEPFIYIPWYNSASQFVDVPWQHQFYDDIQWLALSGITTGYSDGTFRPSQSVERAAMAAYFYRMAGSPEVKLPATSPFKDVDPSFPFYKEIVWMHQQGITTGWPDGTFRPHAPVERQAMAAFIHRYEVKFQD